MTSNNTKLVERPVHYREAAEKLLIKSDDYVIKTLWNPVQDHFSFAVEINEVSVDQKTNTLRSLETLCCPRLSHATIQLKSFIQLMWIDTIS